MKQSRRAWEIYERMIARLIADQLPTGLCVTPNAKIIGDSGITRQLDVLIEERHNTDNSRRVIVDAKDRQRKVTINDVEAFLGMIDDVGATHGYIVTSRGCTKGAKERAQMAVSLRIVPTDRLENFDPSTWPCCKRPGCKDGRIFWDGYPELSAKVAPAGGGEAKMLSFVHYVGKCDRCRLFHVWCTTCNDILAVPHDDESDHGHQCRCRMPWFWLASIEEDEDGNRSAELHAVVGLSGVVTASRRSL